ncbi:MAG: hypothetical protein DSM106950_21860 [Stigonema ocellatum SAG 48.90 = DSM 106950]|nr:hypothetical protein [Stigonema ocellatum SAG 48.90 = DSM 106950]
MKTINLGKRLLQGSFALVCFFSGTIVFAAAAKADVAGKFYKVTITEVGGSVIPDVCFQFDNRNTLSINGAQGPFIFGARIPQGTNSWQAVSSSSASPTVALSGEERPGPFGQGSQLINGNGINEIGHRFTFSGNQVLSCAVEFATPGEPPDDGAIFFQ